MADGNEIQAHAPDGTVHHFPAGTDPTVVDSTMQQYISGKPSTGDNLKTFGREAALGAASGAGFAETQNPITDALKGMTAKPPTGDIVGSSLLGPAYSVGKGLFGSAGELAEGAGANAQNPSSFGPTDPAKMGHGLGSLLAQLLMLRGGGEAAEHPIADSEIVKSGQAIQPAAQKYWGVGPELTKRAVEAQDVKAGQIMESNQQSLAASRAAHESKVADIESQNVAAKKAAQDKYQAKAQAITDANAKAKAQFDEGQRLQSEVQQHTSDLMEHLPELKEQAKSAAQAMYRNVGVKGVADPAELYNDIKGVMDDKLKVVGGTPPVVAKILNDLKPDDLLSQASVFKGAGSAARDPLVMGKRLSEYPPEFQAKLSAKLGNEPERTGFEAPSAPEKKAPDFNQLHEYLSDLGTAAAKATAPDERAALWEARNAVDASMRKLSDAEGKTDKFKAAQANYNQYFNTFEKTWKDRKGEASPVARALQSKDPVSGEILPQHATDILLKDKNYDLAQRLLKRYPAAKTDVLADLKSKTDRIADLPTEYNEKPLPAQEVAKEKPLPTSQAISLKPLPEEIDPQALKVKALKESAQGLRSMKGIRGALDIAAAIHALSGNPSSLLYPIGRRVMSYGLESRPVMNYLSRVSPEDLAVVKSSKIYSSKAAAAKALKGNNP